MRLFKLVRETDVSGVSGTGVVAQGCVFDDGTVACRWLTDKATTEVANSLADYEAIHGHHGSSKIVWLDNLNVETANYVEKQVHAKILKLFRECEKTFYGFFPGEIELNRTAKSFEPLIKELIK